MLSISFGGTLGDSTDPSGSFPRSNTMSQVATESSSPFAELSSSLAAAVGLASPSVVRVDRRRGSGTGIAWAEDLVVTSSFHAPDRTTIGFVDATGAQVEREAEVIGRDPGTDIAVLRVLGEPALTPARFRDVDGLGVGALTLALGRPGRTVRASLRIVGALSGADTGEVRTPSGGRLDRWIETDRQIPRGFAGGPLIDPLGQVIGMSTRTLFRGADLTIPTQTLRRVVDEILAHGGVRRGYLGVGAYPVALPPALAQSLGQPSGALLASVEDGGPAATAGLIVGDILVKLDGAAIGGPLDLRQALLDRGDQSVDAVIVRAGATQTVKVTIGSRS
jgi:S1-C subfamily serine protease